MGNSVSVEEKFWKEQGNKNIIPNTGQEFPEGFDVLGELQSKVLGGRVVLEIGCGVGRLVRAFDYCKYIGVDINESALGIARTKFPEHQFELCGYLGPFPKSNTTVLYTVLLHISDEQILPFLEVVVENTDMVLVCEIMAREWRRSGNPPVYNRETVEYVNLFESLGMKLLGHERYLYERYKDFSKVNRDISFMRFIK